MSLPTLTGVGRLTADPELRITGSGKPMATLSLAFNSRRRNERGEWEDGDVFYVRAALWNQLAENACETLQKGMEVLVTGELRTERWEKDGQRHEMTKLLVRSIAPNLAFAIARVQKATRNDGSGPAQQHRQPAQQQSSSGWGAPASTPADDPWAVPVSDQPPF
jgi:single-strand DNA-binding protein